MGKPLLPLPKGAIAHSFSADPSDSISGILVVDKPEGLTSFAVVRKVKEALRLEKAGHCGTLDPFATGVLVVCLNQATRIADQLSEQDKVYRFTIQLGMETDTLDRTGRVTRIYEGQARSEGELRCSLDHLMGSLTQEVPRYAAVRVQGKRLYEWSRRGIEVTRPKREIAVYRMELLAYRWPEATLEVRCSKGTYVRQLAADIGGLMGCGAHVTGLNRVASGPFRVEHAISMETLEETVERSCWRRKLVSMSEALSHLPAVRIEDQGLLGRLRVGNLDREWEAENQKRFEGCSQAVRLLSGEDQLEALWWPNPEAVQRRRRLRVFRSGESTILER
jgi:tRNA pseudouridine55 synthase